MSTFIPTHQRAKVRQRPSLVCSSLQVFSRCNSIFPGVILALLLHGLFSFAVHSEKERSVPSHSFEIKTPLFLRKFFIFEASCFVKNMFDENKES